jgi:transposase-like protein
MNGVQAYANFPELVLLAVACKDSEEFQRCFGTEEACRRWFFRARWPNGFVCPGCGGRGASWQAPRKVWQCATCHKQTSLTAGTLLQGTKKPLRTWFEAAYLIVQRGVSARTLEDELGLTYKTAWVWGHKLRGLLKGHERPPNAERNESLRHDASRTNYDSVRAPHPSRKVPCACSKLLARDFGWLNEVKEEEEVTRLELRRRLGYWIEPEVVPMDAPPTMCMNASYDLLATYGGSLSEKHLCAYLDEVSFRWNRRRREPREGFETVLEALATSVPRTERTIVARAAATGHPLSIWAEWPRVRLRGRSAT